MTYRLILILIAAIGIAQAGFVGFEGFPWTGTISGPPNPASIITTQYAGQGVLFGLTGVSAGVAVEGCCGLLAVSGTNAAVGLDSSGLIPSLATGDIYFSFLSPANNVSFWIGDGGGDFDAFLVRAYSSANVLIETQNVGNASMFQVMLVSAGIGRVEVDFLPGQCCGFALDDLSFESVAVPEPSTWSLCVIGCAGLLWYRRRRASDQTPPAAARSTRLPFFLSKRVTFPSV